MEGTAKVEQSRLAEEAEEEEDNCIKPKKKLVATRGR